MPASKLPQRTPSLKVVQEMYVEIQIVLEQQQHFLLLRGPPEDAPHQGRVSFQWFGKAGIVKLQPWRTFPPSCGEIYQRAMTDRVANPASRHVRDYVEHRWKYYDIL
jgi:hypothetical protein